MEMHVNTNKIKCAINILTLCAYLEHTKKQRQKNVDQFPILAYQSFPFKRLNYFNNYSDNTQLSEQFKL